MKESDDCKQIFNVSGNEKLPVEVFTNEMMKIGSGLSVSGADPYR